MNQPLQPRQRILLGKQTFQRVLEEKVRSEMFGGNKKFAMLSLGGIKSLQCFYYWEASRRRLGVKRRHPQKSSEET